MTSALSEQRIQRILDSWKAKGCSVAFVQRGPDGHWNGTIKCAGVRDEQGAEVTEFTRFMIASNSKLFTSLASGIALEECGYALGVDTRIKDVLPEYDLIDSEAAGYITFADALSHRTGLPRHDHYTSNSTTSLQGLVESIRHMKPSCAPRGASQYHNPHFDLVALIVERLTGTPFPTYVKARILDPAGMDSTTVSADLFESSRDRTAGFVQMYESSASRGKTIALPLRLKDSSVACLGAGRMSSNATDMSMWMKLLLSNGKNPYDGRQILPAGLLARCMEGVVPFYEYARVAPELSPAAYGMGLYEQSYQGCLMVEHVGALSGWMSRLCLVPQLAAGIFVATNSAPWGEMVCEEIKFAILDELLGTGPVDWHTRFLAERQRKLDEQEVACQNYVAYTLPEAVELREPLHNLLLGSYHCPGFDHAFCIRGEHILGQSPELVQLPWLPFIWGLMQPFFNIQGRHLGLCWRYTSCQDNASTVKHIFGMPTKFELDLDRGKIVGIGLRQIWGAGFDIETPLGKTVRERAEMYFEKAV